MVEHAAVNRVVVGSSPTSGANLFHTKNFVMAIAANSNRISFTSFNIGGMFSCFRLARSGGIRPSHFR